MPEYKTKTEKITFHGRATGNLPSRHYARAVKHHDKERPINGKEPQYFMMSNQHTIQWWLVVVTDPFNHIHFATYP